MRINKRSALGLFGVILAGAAVFLSACGVKQEGSKKNKVVLIAKSTQSAFWKSVRAGGEAAATEYNMEFSFEGPENEEDYETQNEMIRQAVKDGADAIILSAVDYHANSEAVDEAAGMGVQVLVVDSDVDSTMVKCRIGTNNYAAGCMAAEAALKTEGEQLNIGIVNFDKNSENGQERESGFRDTVLEDSRVSIADSINVVSTTEAAKEGTNQMLERHPEINVIVTFNEWTSLGVGHAVRERQLGDATTVVAFDSNVVSVGMLETGEVDALIVQNPYAMGYLAVENSYQLLNGLDMESDTVYTDSMLVTRENMYDDECQQLLFAFE